jgi:hypothetical protein
MSALRMIGADPALPSPSPPSKGPALTPLPAVPPHPPAEALVQARLVDPFRPDRSPPPGRYSLEARSEPDPAYRATEMAIPMELRLRGIALDGRVRLALIENHGDGRGPRVYQAGDTVGAFVLRLVAADSVVLTSSDTTLVLAIERPWQR